MDEPPTFRFSDPDKLDIDRAELSLTTDGAELRGLMRLVLSTSHDTAVDGSILITVPRGTEISSLGITIDEERIDGVMAYAAAARSAYENTVERATDPALLEWVRKSNGSTQLRLRVFPVRHDSPATVYLGLALRRSTPVAFDPGTRVGLASISVDDDTVERSDLDSRLALDLLVSSAKDPRPTHRPEFVRKGVSLVAGPTVLSARDSCPEGEVCLRMVNRSLRPNVPSLQARARAHRMRLPSAGARAPTRPAKWGEIDP